MKPESLNGRRLSWPVIVALGLVPILVVASLIGLAGRGGEDNINAAVVNLDQAVTIEGQPVPMGRQLAAAMLERDGDNISWTLADAPTASAGLKTGEYSAVVTIPREFSEAATSFSANDAEAAKQATIDVEVSDNAPVTDAALAQEIARLATDTINETLTEGYLDGIYVGFNTVGEQFSTIVDGAAQLHDGSSQLAEGTREAAQGATQLSDGMVLLRDNGPALVDGGDQLIAGIREMNESMPALVDGTTQLSDGVGQFADRIPALVGGVSQLNDGAAQLADNGPALTEGASQLADGLRQFSGSTPALVDGVQQLSDGTDQIAGGLEQAAQQTPALVDGVQQLADGAEQLLPGVKSYADGTAQALGGVAQLSDGLDQLAAGLTSSETGGLDELAGGVSQLADGAEGLNQGLATVDQTLGAFASGAAPVPGEVAASADQIAAAFECPVEDPATCAMLQQAFAAGTSAGLTAGFRAGTATASTILNTDDPASGQSLREGAAALSGGLAQLNDGLADNDTVAQMEQLTGAVVALRDGAAELVTQSRPLVDGAPALGDGAIALNDGIQEVNSGIAPLGDGLQELATGARSVADGMTELNTNIATIGGVVDQFATGATQLSTGVTAYVGGVQQLAGGVSDLNAGVGEMSRVSELADGAQQLADGVGQLADGVGQLEDGALAYVDGVAQYTEGAGSAADGAVSLSDGLVQLADGVDELDEGIGTFATELAKGADQVPTYSADDRAKLATVVASPVERDSDLMATGSVALVSLLLVAGLWLGALASFVVARPVPRDVVTSRASSPLLWARTLWLPLAIVAGQGLVLGFLGGIVLELGVGRTFGLMGLLFALGLAFVFANHALAGWLGNIGRGISAVLLAVTVALGLSSAAGWLSPVGAVSPLQNGLLFVRTWLSDGSGEVGLAGTALLMGLIAVVASIMAIAARRRLTVEQYRRAA